MTDFPFNIIGFDLDGTLLDTSGDIANSLNHVLTSIGRTPFPTAEVRDMIGGGAGILMRRALELTGGIPNGGFDQLQAAIMDYYRANIALETLPFPGLIDALDRFDALGVHYAVVTNKGEKAAVQLLDELGMLSRFACVIGGDTLGRENAKPSPAMIHEMIARTGRNRAAFVGDTTYDTRAARNAGVPSVVCSFGFLDGLAHELGGDAVIDHFDELIPTLERLGVGAERG
jgi:phosphoglycolate phosphatase